MNLDTRQLTETWQHLAPILVIDDETHYQRARDTLDTLLDRIGDDETHPLHGLLDTLGTLIHAYEEANHPLPDAPGREVLRLLREQHGLRQSDLPEIGSQGVLSETLQGKRALNVRQIRLLAKRFSVSPAVFV